MEKKKLKDLTWRESDKCGEIEKIAYRGNSAWMQYDEESGFNSIRQKNPVVFDEIEIIFSDRWFIILLEKAETIDLLDAARADIGDKQDLDKEEFRKCMQELLNKGKEIRTLAKTDTSYCSIVKMAACGDIEIRNDNEEISGQLHDLVYIKADGTSDLSEQMKIYSEKLKEFDMKKEEYKEKRKKQLQRYMSSRGFDR